MKLLGNSAFKRKLMWVKNICQQINLVLEDKAKSIPDHQS